MLKLIKSYLKFFYKRIIIIFFLKIYGKPTYKEKFKTDNFNSINLKIKKKNYKIYEIEKGRVFTNKNDITAYITKNNVLVDGSMQFKKFDNINSKNQLLKKNSTLHDGTNSFKRKINGNILSLLSGGAARDNFTHWFTDVIPRIFYLQKNIN